MKKLRELSIGFVFCLVVTFVAHNLAKFPLLHILGTMVTAILLGIILRSLSEKTIVKGQAGINYAAKYILRAGIILMGVRLNMSDIIAAGWQTIFLDISVIVFAITIIGTLGHKLHVENKLTTLVAVGTGVCGAAAIGAVAPIIKAKNEDIAISVTIIAILGTIFTITYTAMLPVLGLSAHQFGVFSGSTLHELAHVIAAAAPGGQESSDIAIVVKLGRVAFVVPVALLLGLFYAKQDQKNLKLKSIPIPWFLFGFLAMALFNTYHLIPAFLIKPLTDVSILLLTMAMAGLGLNVRLADFSRVGYKPILIGLIGSILLSLFGRMMLTVLNI